MTASAGRHATRGPLQMAHIAYVGAACWFVEGSSTPHWFAMDALLDLQAASTATGQPVKRLRTWCATGKLACERDGQTWMVPLSELPRVAGLAADRNESIAHGHAVVAIVPVTSTTPDLGGEIARRLGPPARKVTMSTLALDGGEYLMAVWKASAGQEPDLTPVAELVEHLGGDLLDGEVGGR